MSEAGKVITGSRIMNYPHRTQSFDYDCGATAFLTVVNYFGFDNEHKVNLQTVFDAIGTTVDGTDNEGIESGLRKFNLEFENIHSLEEIDMQLEMGHPVIVCADTYPRDWHYMTLIGNEGGYYIVSDPWAMPISRVKREIFDKIWIEEDGTRWGVGVKGEPKYTGELDDMDVKLARRGKDGGCSFYREQVCAGGDIMRTRRGSMVSAGSVGADKEYQKKVQEVRVLLKLLEQKVSRHEVEQKTDPMNWGYVGDMGHIGTDLKDALSFLKV